MQALREWRALFPDTLAKAVGVSADEILALESGQRYLSTAEIRALAEVLQVPEDLLLDRSHTPRSALQPNGAGRRCIGTSLDGMLRAFGTCDGTLLWYFNTKQQFETVTHGFARGSSIDSAGVTARRKYDLCTVRLKAFRSDPQNALLAFVVDDE